MPVFIDRERELQELNALLETHQAQFMLVYGRRRIGKTTLLAEWAKNSELPYIYWIGRRQSSPEAVRQSFLDALWGYQHPDEDEPEGPQFRTWDRAFRYLDEVIGDEHTIAIFDEFPFAVGADPALPSHLQVAWDHWLKDKNLTLVLAGSHISMMEDLRQHDAPLYGRFTAELPIGPTPFSAVKELFPAWNAVQRISVYATLGGVPFYLQQFNPGMSVSENIRSHLFRRAGFFRNEPRNIITELGLEQPQYEEIITAIAQGAHRFTDIADATNIGGNNLPPLLNTLIDLHLIERRIPATVLPDKRDTTRRTRYYVRDPFLRFHYRFVEKHSELIEMEMDDLLWERIKEQFRSFIGATTFEELSREWLITQARAGNAPFLPKVVGEHWAATEQIDVCAVNWREQKLLLGECKWGAGNVGRKVIRDLFQKSTRVIPGNDWDVYYVFFAREGFTDAAQKEAAKVDAMLITLEQLDADLSDER